VKCPGCKLTGRLGGSEAGKIEGKKVGRILRPETDYHKG